MATHSSILAWKIPMDRGAWWAIVRGVAKSWTQLSDTHTHTSLVKIHSHRVELNQVPNIRWVKMQSIQMFHTSR